MTVMSAAHACLLCPHCKPTCAADPWRRGDGTAICPLCDGVVPIEDAALAAAARGPGAGPVLRPVSNRRRASLWRVLAVAWLGGIPSPALTDEAAVPDCRIERPADLSAPGLHGDPVNLRQ